jgi:hypothetical protein
MPQAFCKNIAIALDTSACLSFHKLQETNLATFFLSQDKFRHCCNFDSEACKIVDACMVPSREKRAAYRAPPATMYRPLLLPTTHHQKAAQAGGAATAGSVRSSGESIPVHLMSLLKQLPDHSHAVVGLVKSCRLV